MRCIKCGCTHHVIAGLRFDLESQLHCKNVSRPDKCTPDAQPHQNPPYSERRRPCWHWEPGELDQCVVYNGPSLQFGLAMRITDSHLPAILDRNPQLARISLLCNHNAQPAFARIRPHLPALLCRNTPPSSASPSFPVSQCTATVVVKVKAYITRLSNKLSRGT